MSGKRPSETKEHLREKLAAVLRDVVVAVDGKLERAIPYDVAKTLTADEVIARFEFDHGVHASIGGSHKHWNLTARLIAEHREKTAKIDIPRIAKTKRIIKKQAEFTAKLLAKTDPSHVQGDAKPAPRKRWASRKLEGRSSFPTGRKMRGGRRCSSSQ